MNRAVDGVAGVEEREQLASAMRADPLLRQEFEELQAADMATRGLFQQLALPRDFSKRVMRRVQGRDVPADESPRLPEPRPFKQRRVRLARAQRNRIRMYAVISGVSAAASVMLLVGVFTGFFTRNGIGAVENVSPSESVADGRQGVLDSEGYNRTDPSTHQPDPSVNNEDSNESPVVDDAADGADDTEVEAGPDKGADVTVRKDDTPEPGNHPDRHPEAPEPRVPDEVVNEDPEPSTEPRKDVTSEPDSAPAPRNDPVVERKPESDPKETAEPEVSPEPRTPEETVAVERPVIGRLSVLSGRVYVQDKDGEWVKLEDADGIREGAHLKTSRTGVALMSFDSGAVTLGRGSEATLSKTDSLTLLEGLAAVERGTASAGHSMELVIDSHRLVVQSGSVFVERNRRGFEVSKAFGVATLTHDEMGSIAMPDDSAYKAEVNFSDTIYSEAAAQDLMLLPGYSAVSRARVVMSELTPALEAREFGRDERAFVMSRVPGGLENLMVHPVSCDAVVDFMTRSVENSNFDGAALKVILDDALSAMIDYAELHSAEDIAGFAGRAALVAENYGNWKEYFNRLLRPAPSQPAKTPAKTGDADCPAEKNKLKRVDKPQRKVVKKPAPPNTDDNEEKDDKKEDAKPSN